MISTFSQAQDYKPLRVGLGIGFAIPSPIGGNNTTGGLIYLESSYRVSDALAVGLKIEAAIMAIQGSTAFAGLSAPGSGSLNGQYYFSNKSFRPFVGLGLGLYSDIASWPEKTYQFGLYLRIGFDAAHFTFNIDYNAVASPASVAKYSYLGIRAGFFIGGGKQ